LLGKVAFQVVDAGLDVASFGASDHVKDALEQVGALNGILGDGYDDYNDYNESNGDSAYIQHLQTQMQQALSQPADQAKISAAVQQDQAWMAIKAAALDPHNTVDLSQALDANGNPSLPPGVLVGADHATSVNVTDPNTQFITSEAGKRVVINPLLQSTYGGSTNADAWGGQGIGATLAGDPTNGTQWTVGPVSAQISTGDNKIVIWNYGKDPYGSEFETPQDVTPH
jgi:hypothetical protein